MNHVNVVAMPLRRLLNARTWYLVSDFVSHSLARLTGGK
jgi:hypothetical protein